MAAVRKQYNATLRTLWAIAKSPELGMDTDDLHAVVFRETGKESMKQLTQGEMNTLARVLQDMKDGVKRDTRSKRTDEGGNEATVRMRRKIYALCDVLGWNNDHRRINAFAKRMCGVERIEWVSAAQCYQIIEALKKMVERKGQAAEAAVDGNDRRP